MNRIVLVVIAIVISVLSFGITGQYGIDARGAVDFSIISLWLFAWLGESRMTISYAVALGIIFDFISFIFFGYWVILFILLAIFINWLKINFLTVSSYFQAVLVLALVTILSHLTTSIILGNYSYLELLASTILNVLVGSVVYYLLVVRLKMLQRWLGRRL